MDDLTFVHVVQCPADLLHDHAGEFLVEFAFLLEKGVELSGVAKLLDEVDMCLVGEEGVELNDVGVAEEALNLNLAYQLH